MNYTKESLKADLKTLGVSTWDWAGNKPGEVRADVKAMNPAAKKGGFEEIAEYCWAAYSKALKSSGDLAIGRVPNLKAAEMYGKVGEMVGDKTLFDPAAQGNLLNMDKWAKVVNDSWILGGVHRQGLFRLASPRVFENLWNANGYFIVTAREILGLLNFGYRLEQAGPWQVLSCKNKVLATTADLLKYDRLIQSGQTVQMAQQLVDPMGSSARAQQQVQNFKNR